MDEKELIEKAIGKYARDCERDGCVFQQPCAHSSHYSPETDVVELCNVAGPLARYRVKQASDGRARFHELT